MRVDRGRRDYVHKADKESKGELEGRKWTGGLYTVGKRMDERFVLSRKRMDRGQAVVASKDPIKNLSFDDFRNFGPH